MSSGERPRIRARLDEAVRICSKNGARLTELRRRVLRLILEAGGPVTAYQLLDRLRETQRSAVPPTIYRSLDFLMGQRLIHKLERLNAFVPCIETGHAHDAQFLICNRCGTVAEIDNRATANAIEDAAEREGFHPQHAVVEIEGTCATCYGADDRA